MICEASSRSSTSRSTRNSRRRSTEAAGRDPSRRGRGGFPPRPGPSGGRSAAGQEEGGLAPPPARAAVHEPVAPRLLDLLRLSARLQRLPLVQPLRPALVPALDRARELPLPLRAGPAD